MKRFFSNIRNSIANFFKSFDMEDIFTFISLSMIFYGFYLYKPMLAYIIVGFIFLFMSRGAGRKK